MSTSPISRQEEATFPVFNHHKEAYAFFFEKYGQDFVLEYSENMDGQNCYFYALVFDHAIYNKGRKLLRSGTSMTGPLALDFLNCYQSIQIMENGHVHIVH